MAKKTSNIPYYILGLVTLGVIVFLPKLLQGKKVSESGQFTGEPAIGSKLEVWTETSPTVRIRALPTTNSNIVGAAARGSLWTVAGIEKAGSPSSTPNEWYWVKVADSTGTVQGWIYGQYLTVPL